MTFDRVKIPTSRLRELRAAARHSVSGHATDFFSRIESRHTTLVDVRPLSMLQKGQYMLQ
jgi:hypothetical protein